MEGSSRFFGVGPTVFFDGRECRVQPRDMEFYALVESNVIQGRGDPFAGLIKSAQLLRGSDGKPDELGIRILVDQFAKSFRGHREATHDDVSRWMTSPKGEAFTIWYCLRSNFDELKSWPVGRVAYILQESFQIAVSQGTAAFMAWSNWKNDLMSAIDAASGEDFLGNLIGLHLPKQTAEAGQQDESSENSAKSTDTDPPKSPDSPDTP